MIKIRYSLFIVPVILLCCLPVFMACSDDDEGNGNGEGETLLRLPVSIEKNVPEGNDAWSISFRYGAGADSTYIQEYDIETTEGVVNYKIGYNDNGLVEKLVKTAGGIPTEYLYLYSLSIAKSSAIPSTFYITKKENGKLVANYKITREGQLLNYAAIDPHDEDVNGSSVTFSYSANLLSNYIVEEEDETEVVEFTYDNKYGIFRNVATPQWFLVTEIDFKGDSFVGNLFSNQTRRDYTINSRGGNVVYKTLRVRYDSYMDNYPLSMNLISSEREEEPVEENFIITYNL